MIHIGSLDKLETQWAYVLNTEPSIGASHQVSVHLAKQFQRRRFSEIDQSETRMACGGHVY
jgi:hypothetical protein